MADSIKEWEVGEKLRGLEGSSVGNVSRSVIPLSTCRPAEDGEIVSETPAQWKTALLCFLSLR